MKVTHPRLWIGLSSVMAISAQALDCGNRELNAVLKASRRQLDTSERLAAGERAFLKEVRSEHDQVEFASNTRTVALVAGSAVAGLVIPAIGMGQMGMFQGSGALAGAAVIAVVGPAGAVAGGGGMGYASHRAIQGAKKFKELSMEETLAPLYTDGQKNPEQLVREYRHFVQRSRELNSYIDQISLQNERVQGQDGVLTKMFYEDTRTLERQVLTSQARLDLQEAMVAKLKPWVAYLNGVCAGEEHMEETASSANHN